MIGKKKKKSVVRMFEYIGKVWKSFEIEVEIVYGKWFVKEDTIEF